MPQLFQPLRIGRRLLIVPAWLEPPADPESILIRIEAGSAFGTGTHPSTRLCLAALERHLKPGDSVLDLGTGTGILSIAAARLGASRVLGLDIEAEAVRVARANVIANGVEEQVRVEEGSLDSALDGRFGAVQASLVMVNILAHVIVKFLEEGLAGTLAPGALLVLSGVVPVQTPEIRARLAWLGLEQVAQEQLEEWVCLLVRASAAQAGKQAGPWNP